VVLASGVTMAIEAEWQPVRVRRFFNFVARALRWGVTWTVFTPNDEATWSKVRIRIEAFLRRLWRRGALKGRPEEAFSFVATVRQ